MNEAELKKAGGELKKGQDLLETAQKELEAKKTEFKEFVVKTEEGFNEHVKKTEKRLEEEAANTRRGVSGSKGCYRDSKFWKSEEGIALKVKQAKK